MCCDVPQTGRSITAPPGSGRSPRLPAGGFAVPDNDPDAVSGCAHDAGRRRIAAITIRPAATAAATVTTARRSGRSGTAAVAAATASAPSRALRTRSAIDTGSERAAPKQLHGAMTPERTARPTNIENPQSKRRAATAPTLGTTRRRTALSSSTTGTARAMASGAGTPRAAKPAPVGRGRASLAAPAPTNTPANATAHAYPRPSTRIECRQLRNATRAVASWPSTGARRSMPFRTELAG